MNKFMETAANRDYSKHWQQPGSFPWRIQQGKEPLPQRPHDPVDNYIRCVTGKQPYWMPAYAYEAHIIWPDCIEEHPIPEVDGYDWWGAYWIMVETAGGMITKPGTRVINDFANWKEEVPWPDISLVDFAADGKKIQAMLDPNRAHIYECVEGIFERLHELMPFDESLMAFYEEPELLEEFFQKMADYKIDTTAKIFRHYGRVDGVVYHDDWGTQRGGFFSNEMFRRQIMPATKRYLDFVKGQGKFVELHSCGKNVQYVPEMIEMGVDMWTPQPVINDPDFLHNTYGTQMSFAFMLPLKPGMSDEEVRQAVRDFVDRYGANGRVMAWIMTDPKHREQGAVAREELFEYSYAYYNRLYGR